MPVSCLLRTMLLVWWALPGPRICTGNCSLAKVQDHARAKTRLKARVGHRLSANAEVLNLWGVTLWDHMSDIYIQFMTAAKLKL